jgi:hypothetical protein
LKHPPPRLGEKRVAGFELQERPQNKQNTCLVM